MTNDHNPVEAGLARDYPVKPVSFTDVSIQDGFWTPRMKTNLEVTVRYDFQKCEETGRISNFAIAGGLEEGDFSGIPYDDSDVFKVIEGAAYSLALQPDPELDRYLDDLIAKIAAAQEPDGYLYTNRTICRDNPHFRSGTDRWINERGETTDGVDSHELYNIGHMYEAAVAHYEATGKRSLLDVAIKSADLIASLWGPGKLTIPTGHQEMEIGLVKLYRATGDRKYLDLSKFLLDCRGRNMSESRIKTGIYYADHKPVTEQTEAVGHSVRTLYMYSGMADVAALTGDASYLKAIDTLWENVVGKKLYVTGGIGARPEIEGFGEDYDLPNNGYNETCAAIAMALWAHRMFLLHIDSKYFDVIERVIYNGFLSGVSMGGDAFFYPNPLETDGVAKFNAGTNERQPWFSCSCCPTNIVRFIPAIPGFVYAVRDEDIYVNLFIGGVGRVNVGGRSVQLTQKTNYPWDGNVKITVEPETEAEFGVCVRIPGWAQDKPVPSDLYTYIDENKGEFSIKVNGEPVEMGIDKGYVRINRTWKKGDTIELDLPMPVRRVVAHDALKYDAGKVAIERGPIVYTLEGADNGGSVFDKVLPDGSELIAEHQPDLLGGVTVIRGAGLAVERDTEGNVVTRSVEITAIPYYAWCHRGANPMTVWIPRSAE